MSPATAIGYGLPAFALSMGFDFFDKIDFLEGWRNYFLMGTFDIFDLVAYALGAAMAFRVLTATSGKSRNLNPVVPKP